MTHCLSFKNDYCGLHFFNLLKALVGKALGNLHFVIDSKTTVKGIKAPTMYRSAAVS